MDCAHLTGASSYGRLLDDEQFRKVEEQLHLHHQTLLAERESLLRGIPVPDKLNRPSTLDRKREYSAAARNKRLLEDLRKTKAKMVRNARFHETKAQRVKNVSKNYWSMVRNLQPLWEQTCKNKK